MSLYHGTLSSVIKAKIAQIAAEKEAEQKVDDPSSSPGSSADSSESSPIKNASTVPTYSSLYFNAKQSKLMSFIPS